ncbi:MAG: hypothetical protein WCV59_04145 [Parcubacteria group bacterium]|jgi:hypothetical protein
MRKAIVFGSSFVFFLGGLLIVPVGLKYGAPGMAAVGILLYSVISGVFVKNCPPARDLNYAKFFFEIAIVLTAGAVGLLFFKYLISVGAKFV